jgi:hypothetical protein
VPQLLQLLGAVLVLGAFLFRARLAARPGLYAALNAVGSGLLAILALQSRLFGFALLEVVWCAGALAALIPRPGPTRPRPAVPGDVVPGDAHVR